jgi:hypothetical protein
MASKNLNSLTHVNLEYTAGMHEGIDENDFIGFSVINDMLVPIAFVDRLSSHLALKEIVYGDVISPRQLCGDEFFNSLTAEERQVLASCILLLIEDGRIELNFSSYTNAPLQQNRAIDDAQEMLGAY